MPKDRKRFNDGDDDIRLSRPKKTRLDQVDILFNPEDEARDSENDPGYTESQKFLAVTRKKVAAQSNEVLSTFRSLLESRKKTSLGVISDHKEKIKAKEYELRKATFTTLDAISPDDASIHTVKDRRQYPAFNLSKPLEQISKFNISKSKAFLEKCDSVSQEMVAAKDKIHTGHTGSSTGKNIKYLQSLLDRRSKRLRLEIHATLRKEDLPDEAHHEDDVEKELWGRFGNVSTELKPAEHGAWRAWTESTENSTKALRRLVKYLPEGI